MMITMQHDCSEGFFPDRGADRRRRAGTRLEKGNKTVKISPATSLYYVVSKYIVNRAKSLENTGKNGCYKIWGNRLFPKNFNKLK